MRHSMRKLKWPWENKAGGTQRRTHHKVGAVPCSDDSVEKSGAEGLSLAWRCVQGGAIVSCGENEERAVGVDTSRRLWTGAWCVGWVLLAVRCNRAPIGWSRRRSRNSCARTLVSTAESVPGSYHVAVLAVPAVKSSDHVVPPASLARK